jgi:hypothetical protein
MLPSTPQEFDYFIRQYTISTSPDGATAENYSVATQNEDILAQGRVTAPNEIEPGSENRIEFNSQDATMTLTLPYRPLSVAALVGSVSTCHEFPPRFVPDDPSTYFLIPLQESSIPALQPVNITNATTLTSGGRRPVPHKPTAAPRGRRGAASPSRAVLSPADEATVVGMVAEASPALAKEAVDAALAGFRSWDRRPAAERAAILERAADLIEARRDRFLALLAYEGGKTLDDGISEIREAADFCRYYAAEARRLFAKDTILPGPTGEGEAPLWR